MPKIAKLAMLALIVCLTAQCAPQGLARSVTDAPAVVNDFCVVSSVIHGSRSDTTETLRQIEKHNAYGQDHCSWKL